MISSSPEFTAAVLNTGERRPAAKLYVDWTGNGLFAAGTVEDLSDQVESITITRTLVGEVPDAVRLVQGSSSAELTAKLTVGDRTDNAKHAAWWFSRFNPASPIAAYERLGRFVRCDVAFTTTAGQQSLSRFFGVLRSLPVRSGDRTATLTALDYRALLRAQVDLPMLVAASADLVQPGLNATWLVDYVLRRNGFRMSPAPRTGVQLSATMHGSAYPEVGSLVTAYSGTTTDPQPVSFGTRYATRGATPSVVTAGGPYRLHKPATLVYRLDRTGGDLTTNPGSRIRMEVIATRQNTTVGSRPTLGKVRSEDGTRFVQVQATTAGLIEVTMNRGDGVGVWTSAVSVAQSPTTGTGAFGRSVIAVTVEFTSAAAVSIGIQVDGVTTAPASVAFTQATPGPPLTVAELSPYFDAESYQVSNEAAGSAVSTIPTGVTLDVSTNELTAVVPSPAQDSWQLLQELAAAEFATAGFVEGGTFDYRTPQRWTQPAAQTPVRTLTAASALLDVGYDDGIDQVRNIIRVPVAGVSIGNVGDAWTAPEVYAIGTGTTLEVIASFDSPVVDLDTSIGTSGTIGQSRFAANRLPSGTGTVITGGITATVTPISATTAKITVRNNTGYALWLADPQGQPSLILGGRKVVVDNNSSVERRDEPSITKFGEQPLALQSNQWRQSAAVADGMAGLLLAQLSQPQPVLTDVPIVGDPRLQLGDRVTLSDPDGLVLTADYWIVRNQEDISTNGYRQTLALRRATTVATYDTAGIGYDDPAYSYGA